MKQEELREILKQHMSWLDSDGKQGKQANFRGASLRNAYLSDASLKDADLTGVDLRGADLTDAVLTGANLTGAKFDLNFRDVAWFTGATVSKDQLCWLVLHHTYDNVAHTLKIV